MGYNRVKRHPPSLRTTYPRVYPGNLAPGHHGRRLPRKPANPCTPPHAALLRYRAVMAKQLTIRGVPDEVGRRLERLSQVRGQSVNATVLHILEAAVGVDERRRRLARYAACTPRTKRNSTKPWPFSGRLMPRSGAEAGGRLVLDTCGDAPVKRLNVTLVVEE